MRDAPDGWGTRSAQWRRNPSREGRAQGGSIASSVIRVRACARPRRLTPPFNPFSFLYLVQISLAAVVLSARWTWTLAALALAGSGFLFLGYRELPLTGLSHAEHMRLHLKGMWVAFGTAAVFIVYFLRRVRRALAEREADLAAARWPLWPRWRRARRTSCRLRSPRSRWWLASSSASFP
jgi:hypothetical protein